MSIQYKYLVLLVLIFLIVLPVLATTEAELLWTKTYIPDLVTAVDTSDTGSYMYAGFSNGTIVCYNYNGELQWTNVLNGSVIKLKYSIFNRLAVATPYTAYLVDSETGAIITNHTYGGINILSDIDIDMFGMVFATYKNNTRAFNDTFYMSNVTIVNATRLGMIDPYGTWFVTNTVNDSVLFKFLLDTYTGWGLYNPPEEEHYVHGYPTALYSTFRFDNARLFNVSNAVVGNITVNINDYNYDVPDTVSNFYLPGARPDLADIGLYKFNTYNPIPFSINTYSSHTLLLMHMDNGTFLDSVNRRNVNKVPPASLSQPNITGLRPQAMFDNALNLTDTGGGLEYVNDNTTNLIWYPEWTVEMWFNTTSLDAVNGNALIFSNKTPTYGYALYLYNGQLVGFATDFAHGTSGWSVVTPFTSTNTWNHVALVFRQPGQLDLYLNGNRVDSITGGGIGMIPTRVGGNSAATTYMRGSIGNGTVTALWNNFIGYIDEVRISSMAIYNGNTYTVPVKPFQNSRKLLMHMDSNGLAVPTAFNDTSGGNHTFIDYGNSTINITAANIKFGTGSAGFYGNYSYSLISTPASDDFSLYTYNWSCSFWMKRNVVDTKTQAIAGISQGPSWYLSAGYLYFNAPVNSASSTVTLQSSSQIIDTNYHHIATFRAGNKVFLYIDGVYQSSFDVTGMSFDSSPYSFDIGGRV